MERRDFLKLAALSAAGTVAGCATNPVTGRSQLMLISKEDEIQVDTQQSPHQFSSDYGPLQDRALNAYIDEVGQKLAASSHRPDMPYSFRGVNAVYVNAYAFPGGSIAVTRGILLELENEAELAALLGHELGHVNARHTASRMSKGSLLQVLVTGLAVAASTQAPGLGQLAGSIGSLGASALLASYSRDDERQADELGMEYMVRCNYSPKGMIQLMDVLRSMNKHEPSMMETMFATHPMSEERYQTAINRAQGKYPNALEFPVYKERYMDHTVRLRAKRKAIEAMRDGEKAMAKENYREAEEHLREALRMEPDDYAGLVMMAKCQYAQDNYAEAKRYAERAEQVYPQEAQAHAMAGVAALSLKDYDEAYADFKTYERVLPGNPNMIFLQGYALEHMGRKDPAAREYVRYLRVVNSGDKAEYAHQRLQQWGVAR